MTSYERVLATIHHQTPDRVPCDMYAVRDVVEGLVNHLGKSEPEEVFKELGLDFRHIAASIEKKQAVPEQMRDEHSKKGTLNADPYGVVKLYHHNFPQAHRIHGPFWDNRDLDSFDWPKPEDVVLPEETKKAIKRFNKAGFCTSASYDNPFKIGYFMCRFDDFMADCLLDQDYIIELVTRIAQVEFRRVELAVEAGARSTRISGDFADQRNLMISPAVFRKVLKPILADGVARQKAINPDVIPTLHSDGNLFDVLSDLIDCGFEAVHPIQLECMDMMEVKRIYGDRMTIVGGMSVQSELPFLSPKQIRSLVRQRIDTLGIDGGFMLAPTNTILPDVKPENTVAMYREATGN